VTDLALFNGILLSGLFVILIVVLTLNFIEYVRSQPVVPPVEPRVGRGSYTDTEF
jgi:hypothetical protein